MQLKINITIMFLAATSDSVEGVEEKKVRMKLIRNVCTVQASSLNTTTTKIV